VNRATPFAQLLEDCESVSPGQHEIEQDHVVIARASVPETLRAVARRIDGKTLFGKPLDDRLPDRLIVFDDEYAHSSNGKAAGTMCPRRRLIHVRSKSIENPAGLLRSLGKT